MQDISNMIKDILRANEENKLAIFIGAGVSVNSGFKSWWEIVDRFNENKKYIDNGSKDYSDEEILKIPQFVYNENEELYFKILEEEYNKLPEKTNPIIDALLELQPNHIITTNYDRLIEYSIEKQYIYGNTMYEDFSRYSRIIDDTGFISAKKPHYFIKMHGDLEDRKSIVLKEDDYLEFSSTHTLVETFIKSLFVNHTILFVGYGLKDNNLKLIMSWVNNFTKKNRYKDNTSKYYYINVDNTELSKYDKEYYYNKNIHIIEASKIPNINRKYDKSIVFSNPRGKNLYKVVKYLNYEIEMSLDDIICKLEIFKNMNAITTYELYNLLNLYTPISNINNGIEYGMMFNENFLKTINYELQSNFDSKASDIIRKTFSKAGIRGVVLSEKEVKMNNSNLQNNSSILESFWRQPEPEYEILWLENSEDIFYNIILSHNLSEIQNIIYSDNDDIDSLLKKAYLYAYLVDTDKSVDIYRTIDKELKKERLSFEYIVTLFNLGIHDIIDGRYQKIHLMMSEKHKSQFYTLIQFYDNFQMLMCKAVEVDRKISKMISLNSIILSSDLKFSEYIALREELYQILRYLINNYIFTLGLGGVIISRGWFEIIETYINTTFKIISPNSNMKVYSSYEYKRIELTNEDIYFLTFYLEPRTLKFYLREYNIDNLNIKNEQQNFLIKLLHNIAYFDILPKNSNYPKLPKLINSTMILIGCTTFYQDKIEEIFNNLEILIINILKSDKAVDYTFFYDSFLYWVRCIYDILEKLENKNQVKSTIKSLFESLLIHFYSSDKTNIENMEFQIQVFMEQKLFINMSNLLKTYFNEVLDNDILINFFDRASLYEVKNCNIVSNFIVELFPVISNEIKETYRIYVEKRLHNLEIVYLQIALENEIIVYSSVIEELLINFCHKWVKDKDKDKTKYKDRNSNPIYIIAMLHKNNIICDMDPYKKFKGYDDFFDFVCFPKEFDYCKFSTDWSTWLTTKKYSTIALESAFDILKSKYENKMLNAPTEVDKQIYYKYFKN